MHAHKFILMIFLQLTLNSQVIYQRAHNIVLREIIILRFIFFVSC